MTHEILPKVKTSSYEKQLKRASYLLKQTQRHTADLMSDLSFGVEDQSFVQSISHPLHQLLPDAIFQKLLRIHLKISVLLN